MRNKLLAFGLLLNIVAFRTEAAELVIFETTSPEFKAGQIIDGNKPLILKVGQSVSLLSPSGKMLKIQGPFEAAPALQESKSDGPEVIDALKGLVAPRKADKGSLGVIRDAGIKVTDKDDGILMPEAIGLPEPWVIDISNSGNHCVRYNSSIVFWRYETTNDVEIKITKPQKGWAANTVWPKGFNKLEAPSSLILQDGEKLEVEIENQKTQIAIHVIPGSVANETMQTAWMNLKKCTPQASALLSKLK